MKQQQGFTLVEVMVVVGIIAILASIAIPSYQQYLLRSNRAIGKSLLIEVQSRQESYFSDRKRYAADLKLLNYPASKIFYVGGDGNATIDSAGSLYKIEMTKAEDTRYTVTATPQGRQEQDLECKVLTLRHTGKKEANGSQGAKCWR